MQQSETSNSDHRRLTKREYVAAFVCAVSFFLLNLYALDRSPMLFCDEPTLNEPAKELALNGVYRSVLFAESMGFERYYYWQPPGYPLFMAGVYSIFGFGVLQMRIVSVFFGSCVIGLVFLLTKVFLQRNWPHPLQSLSLHSIRYSWSQLVSVGWI